MITKWPLPSSPSEFEDFCCMFLKHVLKSPDMQRNGRSGQAQNGIDILGTADGCRVAAQCKLRDGKPPRLQDLLDDIEAATEAFPGLARLYIFISTDRDTVLLRDLHDLSDKRVKQGLFPVSVVFWPDLWTEARSDLILFEKLRAHYLPDIMSNERQTEILRQEIKSGFESMRPTPATGSGASLIDIEIDAIWRRVDDGKLEYAIEAYTDIQKQQWNELTGKQKYRVLANLGSVHSLQGDYIAAARYYHEAASHYDSQASRLIDAMGYWFENNLPKAFEIATAECGKDPLSSRAHMIRLRTLTPRPTLAEAVKSVPDDVLKDPEVLSVLHSLAVDEGHLPEAERYARLIVEVSPDWVDGGLMLCNALLQRVQDSHWHAGVPLSDPAISTLMAECRRLVDQIIANTKALSSHRANALHIRSILYFLAGDHDNHLRDLRMAWQLDPNDLSTIFALAQAEADRGRYQDGVDLLRAVPELERTLFWARAYGECLRGLGPSQYREALDSMLGFLQDLPNVPIGAAIDYLLRAGRLAIELGVGDELVRRVEASAVVPLVRDIALAVLAFEMNRIEDASQHITNAAENLPTGAGRAERQVLATGFAKIRHFARAVDILSPVVRTDVFGDVERLYIRSLWQADLLRRVIAHCRASKANGVWNQEILMAMVDALMAIPSPSQAMAVLTEWLADHPEDTSLRLHLGAVQFMAGHADKICTDLSKLPSVDTCTPGDGFQVVQLLLNAEPPQPCAARRYAYGLWRRCSEEKEACQALVTSLFHASTDRSEYIPPATVVNDTAVVVKTAAGEIETYVIETGPSPRQEYDEISPDHPIATALLGRRKDDEVQLPALGAPRKAVIVAIDDKMVFRGRSLGNSWQRKWPNDTFVRPVGGDSPQKSVDEFLDFTKTMLQAQHSHGAAVYEQYVGLRFSIHMLARATGTTACMAILKLSAAPKHTIVACSGSAIDRRAASEALQSRNEIVLDSTALAAAIVVSDVAKALRVMPTLRAAPDVVLAEFRETIKTLYGDERAVGSVGLDEAGQVRVYELSAEQRAQDHERLERSCSVVLQNVQPADSEIVLDLVDGSDRTKSESVLGTSLHAIALAKSRGAMLWTDDFVTAQLARGYGVQSVCSAAVLTHLRDTGVLAAPDAERGLATLYLAGWRAPYLHTGTLLQALNDSEWRLDDPRLRDLFGVFGDSKVGMSSLSDILANLCYSLENGPDKSRLESVIELVLPIFDRHIEGRIGIERAAALLRSNSDSIVTPAAPLKIDFWLATAPPRIVARPTRLWLPSRKF